MSILPALACAENLAAPSSLDCAPLVELLRAVLVKTGEIVIRPMHEEDAAAGYLGLTHFATRSVFVAEGQDDAEWLTTLIHELHHHLLGPCEPRFADAAEQLVEDATARTLAAMGEAGPVSVGRTTR